MVLGVLGPRGAAGADAPPAPRCSLASLLTIALHGKLEYYTGIMKELLVDLIDASAAKNPKLMLRRTESVVEKMLTNWMSICMYSCLRVRAPAASARTGDWERGWPTGSVTRAGESRLRATLGTEAVSGRHSSQPSSPPCWVALSSLLALSEPRPEGCHHYLERLPG